MTQQPSDNELRIKLEEIFYPKFGEYKGVRPAAIVTLPSDLDAKKVGMRQSFNATINDILALIQDEILKARIAMLNEVIHQSRNNLKTSEAVAQWAEMRIVTLSTKD